MTTKKPRTWVLLTLLAANAIFALMNVWSGLTTPSDAWRMAWAVLAAGNAGACVYLMKAVRAVRRWKE